MHNQHWMKYATGSATASAVDEELRPYLQTRGYFCVVNTMPVTDMAKPLWINFGEAATGSSGPAGIPVYPGQRFELNQTNMSANTIHTAGASITFSWVEGTRA